MEDVSTLDLISYRNIKLHLNGFNYAHQKNDAPAKYSFGILRLCDVRNVTSTIE